MTENILSQVSTPTDVKSLSVGELERLAEEIRQLVLTKVSKHGGHLGPNLASVEFTLAFHYVFDSPRDKIVWDVSHQSYPHKIVTGRKHGFIDEENYDSVTGYSNQHESEHDFFTVGHTSTSVSLATGLAKARDLNGAGGNVIAVIGDGSLSGGMAFEGLNNGAVLGSNLIVLVNDNEMSIAENQGGLYKNLRLLRETNGTAEENMFKAIGFDYRYVEAGNDMATMIAAFEAIKDIDHPIVLHVHTEKGHGYEPATTNKEAFHWHSPFDLATGKSPAGSGTPSYASVMMDYLEAKVQQDDRVVAINAAIPGALGLGGFRSKHPDKYFDVGIAEAHSIAFASAMASQGMKPIVFHSSTFIQRTYDQISHDLCINNNPAVIVIKGATISGSDVTHLGVFDIAMMSNIPNLVYLAPTSQEELTAMMEWALAQDQHPVAVRLPEQAVINRPQTQFDFSLNTYEQLHAGSKVAIIGLGSFLSLGEKVQESLNAKGIDATLINPRFITGIDKDMLNQLKANHDVVITLEDGILDGGFGEKISRYYGADSMKVLNYGAIKEFTDSVPKAELYRRYRLEPELIVADILALLK
ncbi:1-deoxy-D-xylulose-5-phosphate synthase [Culicoidibacter larvae]|uniref:1-deoxy-D-xylulose-5-phosphate synthase n=1 Tax=Culicoidibacter larvae TaxID=2579976 RepID=A0A5R8QDV1_9FIRM|nr:1-deoxy-D-xylulose-5-phosphate synthase [Culicoidibacter larvae]TLG75411.1 1-deoxy-D-xylulose-5-phosphate synthase [Culicoidibacter larvae]